MTDSNRDSDFPFQAGNDAARINADDAPLAPRAHDDISADVHGTGSHAFADEAVASNAIAEPVFEDKPQLSSGSGSKDIVLQRLSPRTSWDDLSGAHEPQFDPASPGIRSAIERRSLSMAAVVMIAAGIGAVGGGLASAGAGFFLSEPAKIAAANEGHAIESAITKLNADLAALKSSGATQSGKIIDRMDRIEKAQAEPAAKLAKLSEAVDKLRAPEITGSIAAPSVSTPPVAAIPPNRLPVVSGWILRDVGEGAARVEGRLGIYEVYPGDPLPGLGSVDAIRKQDGRWVVVTSRGLIVSR